MSLVNNTALITKLILKSLLELDCIYTKHRINQNLNPFITEIHTFWLQNFKIHIKLQILIFENRHQMLFLHLSKLRYSHITSPVKSILEVLKE